MKYLAKILLAIVLLGWADLFGQPPAGYYDGTAGLTGEPLKSKLHLIIRNHTVKTYSEVKDVLRDIDEDPNNSSNVLLIYSRKSISKNDFASNNESDFWNREHTWPKSHGFPNEQDTAYTDVHHLRPCDATINSSRSNKDFNDVEHIPANEEGEAPSTYTTDDFWEPVDEVKGDLARTMFYMATRYNSAFLDLELVDRISYAGDPELGVLYTLLQWHENDPVSQAEIDRNNGAFGYQGNRNPFIDAPSWVADVWGISTDPYMSINQYAFNVDFGSVKAGEDLVQQYGVKGYNLIADINVTVGSPFELSLDNATWSNNVTIANSEENPQETTVFIRFSPDVADASSFESIVTHSTNGANALSFNVMGTEGGIPQLTIAEARGMALNEVVSVKGVVIDRGNNSGNSRVIFDGTAGIVVRSFDAGNESSNLNYGDSIAVTGGLGTYNNLLQIVESPISIELLKQNALVPEPQLVSVGDIDESYESELVTVENVEFTNSGTFAGGGSSGNFMITDGVDRVVLRIGSSRHPFVGSQIPSGKLSITGFVGQFRSDYQLSPRDANDIVVGVAGEGEITGIEHDANSHAIFPNPVKELLYIEGLSKNISAHEVSIASLDGKSIRKNYAVYPSYINVGKLKRGVYVIQLNSAGERITLKFIKE